MTLQELKAAVAAREGRLYIFAGEEEYLKRYWLSEMRRAFVPDETYAGFNHMRFEGTKPDMAALEEALLSPPMMADEKLVEWHLLKLDLLTQKELAALAEMAEMLRGGGTACVFVVQPEDFDLGNYPKKPSKMYTSLSKFADIVVFETATEHQLLSWVQRRFFAEDIRILPAVAQLLLDKCGHRMDTLASEIGKTCAYLKAHGKSEVTSEAIAFVTAPTEESDAFQLSNALLSGNVNAAYLALREMKGRQLQPTYILSATASVYTDLYRIALLLEDKLSPSEIAKELRLHEYKVGLYAKAVRGLSSERLFRAVMRFREADAAMKSGGQTGYAFLERLLGEILLLLQ